LLKSVDQDNRLRHHLSAYSGNRPDESIAICVLPPFSQKFSPVIKAIHLSARATSGTAATSQQGAGLDSLNMLQTLSNVSRIECNSVFLTFFCLVAQFFYG
jgi:hypothetical protein